MVAYISYKVSGMPTIRRFATCKISIYANDHLPPHFHIEGLGFRIIVAIETMMVRAGNARHIAKAAEAMKWAGLNVAFLKAEWDRINQRSGE
jgi:hypothetical protein